MKSNFKLCKSSAYEGRLKSFEPNIERIKIRRPNLVHKNFHISKAYRPNFLVITIFILVLQVFEHSVSGELRSDHKMCLVSPEQCSSAFTSGCHGNNSGLWLPNCLASTIFTRASTIGPPGTTKVIATTDECAGALFW